MSFSSSKFTTNGLYISGGLEMFLELKAPTQEPIYVYRESYSPVHRPWFRALPFARLGKISNTFFNTFHIYIESSK